MKTSAALKTYFRTHLDSLMILLRKPAEQFGPKDYHTLRVDIKRIKALLFLIDSSANNFKKRKYYKPFRQLFRQAGKVRELQLEEAMLKKYGQVPALTSYFNQLDQELQNEQRRFFTLIDQPLRKDLNARAKKVDACLDDIKSPAVNKYLQEKRDNIKSLLSTEKLQEQDVHLLRKRIKELYYLQRIFQLERNHLDIADDFQELLGQWHDSQVISKDLLKDAKNHKRPSEEIKAIMSLHKKISGQAARLLAKIEMTKHKV